MKQITILAMIALLLFTACGTNTGTSTKLENPFIGGTEGLLIDFVEDSPPDEVYAGGDFPFDVVVKLKNEGETKVAKEEVEVTLSGINAGEFSKEETEFVQNPPDDLEPMRKENEEVIDSIPVHVEFTNLNREEDFSGNTYTIRADVCYKYETDAITKICIRKDNLDTKEGVCEVNEGKEVFSSGAPVAVTEVKEAARGKDKIAFTYKIEHKGNGQAYKSDSGCGEGARRANEDRIWVEVSTGLEGLECTGLRDGTETSGFATIFGGDTTLTCTQTVTTNSDFEKPVEFKLIYDYEDNAETSVLVKHSGAE